MQMPQKKTSFWVKNNRLFCGTFGEVFLFSLKCVSKHTHILLLTTAYFCTVFALELPCFLGKEGMLFQKRIILCSD